jgi:hypothetical protein
MSTTTDASPATQADGNWRALRERLIKDVADYREARDIHARSQDGAGRERASGKVAAVSRVLDLMDEFERASQPGRRVAESETRRRTPDRPPAKSWRVYGARGLSTDYRSQRSAYEAVKTLTGMKVPVRVWHWENDSWRLYEKFNAEGEAI